MFIKKHLNLIIVSLLALVFFVGTSSFNYLTQDKNYVKWSSPDETANYFFASRYSQTGELAFFDKANIIGDNLVMPRSVRCDEGWIKPVSFLGIILIYGSLGAIFGTAVIPFLTPFFAALGIILFYLIIRKLFSEKVGFWSAFLLACFPVYIYYSTRSMFHNVLFIVLLLAGVYFFSLALGEKKDQVKSSFLSHNLSKSMWLGFLASLASGFFVGLAIITRTSELLWLAPVLFLVWLFYARRLGLTKPFLFLSGLALALIPVAYYNQILYDSFWHGGYNEMNRSLDDIARTGGSLVKFSWLVGQFAAAKHALGQIFRNVFYFGFKYDQSVTMFRHYGWEMFPGLFYAGLFGLLLLIIQSFRRFQKKYLIYIMAWLFLGALLVFYYGSWKFNDNPDLTRFTIGNSYTRYWLPLYLGLMPLAALALVRTSEALVFIKKGAPRRIKNFLAFGLQSLIILAYVVTSLIFVVYGSEEGLAYLYYNNCQEKTNTEKVWQLTEPEGVIITRYYDKFFWPERRVIMGTIPNEEILTSASKLAKKYPLYYFNFYLTPADVDYLNKGKLVPYRLEMKFIQKTNASSGLYRLTAY